MKKEIINMQKLIDMGDLLSTDFNELHKKLKEIETDLEYELYVYFINEKYNELKNNLSWSQRIINTLKKKIKSNTEKSAYYIGYLNGVTTFCNKLANYHSLKEDQEIQIEALYNDGKASQILNFIYNKKIVQHKQIVKHYGDYSNQVLNYLNQLNYITKTKRGKYTFYSLTPIVIKFIEKKTLNQNYDIYFKSLKKELSFELENLSKKTFNEQEYSKYNIKEFNDERIRNYI